MTESLEVARELALEGGCLVEQALGAPSRVEHKSAVDLVTEVDHAVQRIIVDGLRRAFPSDSIVAEEGDTGLNPSGRCWYIDPIDGTTNFVHGLPHCSVSIGLLEDGVPQCAVVFDPCKDEMFTAVRGQGAFLGDRKLSVSSAASLDQALLVTGFPYDRRENLDLYMRYFSTMLCEARDLRRLGSAALDLCYVAAGRFDGFWEWNLHPWDTAAGWLVVLEAGGTVCDYDGGPYNPWLPRILATNGLIQEPTSAVLQRLMQETE